MNNINIEELVLLHKKLKMLKEMSSFLLQDDYSCSQAIGRLTLDLSADFSSFVSALITEIECTFDRLSVLSKDETK